jgi:radical SAM superfamily enzyme YgiQ (UPF0313 family)
VGKSLYLINPAAGMPGYWGAEIFSGLGMTPTIAIADLAIATVAAMVPDDFHVQLCDEHVETIDMSTTADFIGITGKVSQWGRMKSIADEFRRRGKTIIIGGPYASLSPDVVRPHCDILIRGEMEEIASKIFADIRSGHWQSEYVGTRPDLRTSPLPRWDLYPNDRAIMGTVQTSRGCPFECEFCDVIEYLGRKQRHKQIDQVLGELDQLYRLGYRMAFLADDNFTVYRARAKALLAAIRDWNIRQTDGRMQFSTQVSIDAAGDEELLALCADAGLTHVFIGIETPNEESLRLAKKRQNLKKNLLHEIQRFIDFGILVDCGMIVGFDGDDSGIFARQYEFAMSTAVPIFTLGLLVAPPATPLYDRLAKEGRLIAEGSEIAAAPWTTNIVPKMMTRTQLSEGVRWLCNAIYRPEAFEERIVRLIKTLGQRRKPLSSYDSQSTTSRPINVDSAALVRKLSQLGPAEAKMVGNVLKMVSQNRDVSRPVMGALLQYHQVRFMYEGGQFWEPTLAPDAGAIWQARRLDNSAIPARSPGLMPAS